MKSSDGCDAQSYSTIPNADVLVLIGQMLLARAVVEGGDGAGGGAVVVLGAAGGRQVVEVTRELGDLKEFT